MGAASWPLEYVYGTMSFCLETTEVLPVHEEDGHEEGVPALSKVGQLQVEEAHVKFETMRKSATALLLRFESLFNIFHWLLIYYKYVIIYSPRKV